MDIEAYVSAAVQGVPLLFVVMGLAYLYGLLGAQGKTQLILSFLTGVLFGTVYMVLQVRPPVGPDWYPHFVYWAGNAIYGIGMGLIPSGVYESVKKANEKGYLKALQRIKPE